MMSTDGSSSTSSSGENDVVIPITAEDKLTAVFAQMSASIDDKLAKMVDSMNRRTASVDANFKRMADSSKQMDRIGDAVDQIDSRFNRLWKTTIGLGGAFAAFQLAKGAWSFLKDSLGDTPIGQAGGAAATAFDKAWSDVIGKINGRFKPEIDALASGIQYLGDVAVNVVVPELGVMSQSLADLFFGKLQAAGINAHTFTENTSNNFHGLAVNVVRAVAVMETAMQNWNTTWEIMVTSSAIGTLDIEDNLKKLGNTIDRGFMDWIVSPMISGMDQMQAKWEQFFDYTMRGAQEWQRVFKGVDMTNPVAGGLHAAARALAMPPTRSTVGHNTYTPRSRNSPGELLDANANDGARKILEERLRKLMDGMGQAVGANLERMLEKLGLVGFGPLRANNQAAGGLGNIGGGNRGGAGNTNNLLETGFLTRAGSSSFDPQVQMLREQLVELKKQNETSTALRRAIEDILRRGDNANARVILQPQGF